MGLSVDTSGLKPLMSKAARMMPEVEHIVAIQAAKDMEKFVPKQSGQLANARVEANEIVYWPPYAHYQYEGILFVDPNTGSAWSKKGITKVPTGRKLDQSGQPHWDKAAAAQYMGEWERVAAKAVKKALGE